VSKIVESLPFVVKANLARALWYPTVGYNATFHYFFQGVDWYNRIGTSIALNRALQSLLFALLCPYFPCNSDEHIILGALPFWTMVPKMHAEGSL
jgi:hypothetical protein